MVQHLKNFLPTSRWLNHQFQERGKEDHKEKEEKKDSKRLKCFQKILG